MKKIYNLLLFTVLAAGLAACSSDEEKTDVAGPAAGNLQIIMRTPQAAAGRGPAHGGPPQCGHPLPVRPLKKLFPLEHALTKTRSKLFEYLL